MEREQRNKIRDFFMNWGSLILLVITAPIILPMLWNSLSGNDEKVIKERKTHIEEMKKDPNYKTCINKSISTFNSDNDNYERDFEIYMEKCLKTKK